MLTNTEVELTEKEKKQPFNRVSLSPSAIEIIRNLNKLEMPEVERDAYIYSLKGLSKKAKSPEVIDIQNKIYYKYKTENEGLKGIYGVDLNCWFKVCEQDL